MGPEPGAPPRPRVLVVEDEWLIAEEIAKVLEDMNCEVVGPAPTAPKALSLIERNVLDAAVLDVSIRGATALPVADALRSRGTPFLFVTGYLARELPEPYRDYPVISKPVAFKGLRRALSDLLGRPV